MAIAVRRVVDAVLGANESPGALVLFAHTYAQLVADQFCAQLDGQPTRARVLDSLRLEITRTLAALAEEHTTVQVVAFTSTSPSIDSLIERSVARKLESGLPLVRIDLLGTPTELLVVARVIEAATSPLESEP